jgi:hypothetical protein
MMDAARLAGGQNNSQILYVQKRCKMFKSMKSLLLDELRTEQETTAHNDNVRRQAEAQIKELQIKVMI